MSKVKEHFKKHKTSYIVGGSCLVVGAGLGVLFKGGQLLINDSLKVQIASPTTNNITMTMTRPGPKSFVIQCSENQKVWPSIRSAAKDLGVEPSVISKHLKGLKDSVDGLHFEKLHEV